MAILAIDSSTSTASVAVVDGEKVLCEQFLNVGLTHSQTLMPMVKSTLDMVKCDIDTIAVTVGPGSFTGVRIGVACAKGLAMTKNTPCKEVSTIEALAYNIKHDCTVCVMFDARLKRVYTAKFKIENGEVTRLTNDDCLTYDEVSEQLNGIENLLIIGDGANLFAQNFTEFEKNVDTSYYLKASLVAKASEKIAEKTANEINPLYLQLAQAERERLQRINNK